MTETKYKASSEVWPADLGDGDTALFDSRNQRYLTVNETGRAIWETFKQPSTIKEAATALTEEFTVDQKNAEAALAEFIPQLLEENLIQLI